MKPSLVINSDGYSSSLRGPGEKIIFVTAWQMNGDTAQLRYAQDDGYCIVVVPEDTARSFGELADLNGRPSIDVDRYRRDWNDSFTFINVGAMTPAERAVYARALEIAALARCCGGCSASSSW